VDFITMLTLEEHGPDTFVGTGPRYPWGGLYGGQIVAQALRAAAHTVEDRFRVHSLHAYFIRRGDHSAPIRFEVDRLRDGRSFVTRAVVARQAGGAILNLSASFQVDEEAIDVQTAVPPAAADPRAR
jgi:acyl-CoA thioesterase-2